MARKNLSNRPDIPSDVLRQRRDLYAFALGLVLFHLAGGELRTESSVAVLLPVKLTNPEFLYTAAWAAFAYFWLRLAIVSDEPIVGSFREDILWQWRDSRAVREVALPHVRGHSDDNTRLIRDTLADGGEAWLPRVLWTQANGLHLSLNSIGRRANRTGPRQTDTVIAGDALVKLSGRERLQILLALPGAVARAIVLERGFTDYTLPHAIACFCVLLGFLRWACT